MGSQETSLCCLCIFFVGPTESYAMTSGQTIVVFALCASLTFASPPPPEPRDLPCAGGGGMVGRSAARHLLPLMEDRSHNACDAEGACYWDGEAPFCEGNCPDGYDECGRDDCGDGSCCWTGHKACCCRLP